MSNANRTPWTLRFRNDLRGIIRNCRNEIMAEVPPAAVEFGPLLVAAPSLHEALTKARAFIEHERDQRAAAYDGPGLDEETGAAADELRAYVDAPARLLTAIDDALMRALPTGAPILSANGRSPT